MVQEKTKKRRGGHSSFRHRYKNRSEPLTCLGSTASEPASRLICASVFPRVCLLTVYHKYIPKNPHIITYRFFKKLREIDPCYCCNIHNISLYQKKLYVSQGPIICKKSQKWCKKRLLKTYMYVRFFTLYVRFFTIFHDFERFWMLYAYAKTPKNGLFSYILWRQFYIHWERILHTNGV